VNGHRCLLSRSRYRALQINLVHPEPDYRSLTGFMALPGTARVVHTILVGGSGDYFDVADAVNFHWEDFKRQDVTTGARGLLQYEGEASPGRQSILGRQLHRVVIRGLSP